MYPAPEITVFTGSGNIFIHEPEVSLPEATPGDDRSHEHQRPGNDAARIIRQGSYGIHHATADARTWRGGVSSPVSAGRGERRSMLPDGSIRRGFGRRGGDRFSGPGSGLFLWRPFCFSSGTATGLLFQQSFTLLHLLRNPIQNSGVPLPRGLLHRLPGYPFLFRDFRVNPAEWIPAQGIVPRRLGLGSFHISFILGILKG